MAKKGIRCLKLIQLNAWYGRLESQIADFLKRQKPDILCLQESISFNKGNAAAFHTVESIKENEDLKYSVMAPMFSFNLMNGTAIFGNSILSKVPILKSEIIYTNLEYRKDFDFNDHDSNVRNFIHAVIEINGKQHNVLTHHGYHVLNHKNGDAHTLRQMKQLGEYLDTLEGPIILTGDFNLAPHSESLEQINSRLINLSLKHHLKTTRTRLTHKTEVCDYIFINNEVKVSDFYVSDEIVSDHKALILEFGALET